MNRSATRATSPAAMPGAAWLIFGRFSSTGAREHSVAARAELRKAALESVSRKVLRANRAQSIFVFHPFFGISRAAKTVTILHRARVLG